MRILHVIATLDLESGGPAKACLEMAAAVAKRGHHVDIFTTDWAFSNSPAIVPDALPEGLNVITFPVHFPRFWKASYGLMQALRQTAESYDVFDIHSLYLFHDLVAPMAARRAGKPYIVRPHGLLDPYIWRRHRLRKAVVELAFQNRAIRNAAAIHYTSLDEQRISQPHACGAAGVVVPLGVDLPPPRTEKLQHPRRILFLSRLHAKKGLDLLIPAFAEVKKRFADAELVVAGPDDGALHLAQHLVEQHGLGESVSFPGMLHGIDKERAFAEAGIFVLPSYSENFGIAIAEAMAAELPVIVTDQVNIHDDISQADAGLVVPCEIKPLTDALNRLLADPVAAAQMGQNGRALVASHYSWPVIGQQLEALYQDLIDGKR